MESRAHEIVDLKKQLLHEVASFYKADDRLWKEPVTYVLRTLREQRINSVFFGGTLRSLLLSRLYWKKPGRPRDIDIVVAGVSVEVLREIFNKAFLRETRFGGLKLRSRDWDFDVWPLNRTWAFNEDRSIDPAFEFLPSTTVFNLEAIAVDVWSEPGHQRQLFSGNDQFFEGIISKTVELNRAANPFPELSVVRGLLLASMLQYEIGPKLAGYVAEHGVHLTPNDLEDIQRQHYRALRLQGDTLSRWIDMIAEVRTSLGPGPVRLPGAEQLGLWTDWSEGADMRFHTLQPK